MTTVTWNPLNRALHTTLSGGNLTVTGSVSRTVGVAVDIPNKLVWFRNAATNRWNASNTADPASGTGGISFTPGSGLFPAASIDPNGTASTTSVTGAFAAASMQWTIPSGFSAWDTLAGSATTWNPSDKNAAITLTGSNLIATASTGSSYVAVRATNSLSSGKAYWEFTWSTFTGSFASTFSGMGLGTSSMSLSNFVGAASASSFSINCTGGINGATGSGDTSAYLTTTANLYSGVLATLSRSSGKYYFETTVATIDTSTGFHLGLGDGNVVNFGNFPGFTTHGYSVNVNNGTSGVFYNNSAVHTADSITHSGKTIGVAVDFGAALIWFWCNDGVNRWNASGVADPATGTGGFDISSLLGVAAAQFPIIAPVKHDSVLVATANFGATSFVNTLPTGFTSWDGSQPGDAGTFSWTEPTDTFAFTGVDADTGTFSWTEPTDTFAFVGTDTGTGTFAWTEPTDTFAFTGTDANTGTFAWTEPTDTFAFVGNSDVLGTFAFTEPTDTFAFTGTDAIMGTMAFMEPPDSIAFYQTGLPSVRQKSYKHRFLGRSFDPQLVVEKDRPGPLRIIEADFWMD